MSLYHVHSLKTCSRMTWQLFWTLVLPSDSEGAFYTLFPVYGHTLGVRRTSLWVVQVYAWAYALMCINLPLHRLPLSLFFSSKKGPEKPMLMLLEPPWNTPHLIFRISWLNGVRRAKVIFLLNFSLCSQFPFLASLF